MKAQKKKPSPGMAISWLLGLACALVLGALFYGAMVYQLTGENVKPKVQTAPLYTPVPLSPGLSSTALYPGRLLGLSGARLVSEKARDENCGGETCRVITRTYALSSGGQASVISAYPAAYLEWIPGNGFEAQLITGYTLAEMDAVCARRGNESLLSARDGDCVYILQAQADEQALYALGVSTYLE